MNNSFTPLQGQYLAYIVMYTKLQNHRGADFCVCSCRRNAAKLPVAFRLVSPADRISGTQRATTTRPWE
jgi:hypothetical protein